MSASSTASYSGTRLTSVNGGGLSTGSYGYDAAGRATTDGRTGTVITYNHLDLPVTFTKTGLSLTYSYDAEGNKLRKINATTSTTTDYIAGSSTKMVRSTSSACRLGWSRTPWAATGTTMS